MFLDAIWRLCGWEAMCCVDGKWHDWEEWGASAQPALNTHCACVYRNYANISCEFPALQVQCNMWFWDTEENPGEQGSGS